MKKIIVFLAAFASLGAIVVEARTRSVGVASPDGPPPTCIPYNCGGDGNGN